MQNQDRADSFGTGGGINLGDDPVILHNNIVYCRVPYLLPRDKDQPLNLKTLIQHENLLDVKQLIKTQQTQVHEAFV